MSGWYVAPCGQSKNVSSLMSLQSRPSSTLYLRLVGVDTICSRSILMPLLFSFSLETGVLLLNWSQVLVLNQTNLLWDIHW